jgi:glycosyltransferase involved in cell wall biosynthesis
LRLRPAKHKHRRDAPRALILIENESYPLDRRVLAEARSLRANGYTVSVISPARPGEAHRESVDGVTVRRYRAMPSRGGAVSQVIEYVNALAKTSWLTILLSFNPGFDVIHASNPPDLFFLVAWPFRLAGKRFIFDQHDLSPDLYLTLYGRERGAVMSVLRWSERLSYRHANAVITPNESYKRLAQLRGGLPEESVFVVRNGPRDGWPRPVPPDPSLKKGRPYLAVYVGTMGYQDGIDVLLRVVDNLVNRLGFHEVTFALIGDGQASAEAREQAENLGLSGFIDFTGWILDEGTLLKYLATADVCISPEPPSPLNDHSTFIKVMEYMATGTPIVAFDLPETRFSAGEAALYAAPDDIEGFARLVREALVNEALRERMIAAAKQRMPELRWERQVPNLLSAYERALSERRGHASRDHASGQ